MRVLVCGSRDFSDYHLMDCELKLIDIDHGITEIIHGNTRGADQMAASWAISKKIPVRSFPADWKKYGLAAGPIRNKQMLDEGKPDLCLAFPVNGLENSIGTKNMVKQARAAGIKTIVINE